MQDILIRIETDDFAAWAEQHYLHAGNRATYGIEDGPAIGHGGSWVTAVARGAGSGIGHRWMSP